MESKKHIMYWVFPEHIIYRIHEERIKEAEWIIVEIGRKSDWLVLKMLMIYLQVQASLVNSGDKCVIIAFVDDSNQYIVAIYYKNGMWGKLIVINVSL